MSSGSNWSALEQRIGAAVKVMRRPVAVTFLDSAPANVEKFSGTEPSGCSFWRLAAGGRTFYTVPENHFNCAVGAYTHNITLSPEREKETEQTLKMMFDLGYVKPEEVPQIPQVLEGASESPCATPLGRDPVEPDVILFACKPSAAMLLDSRARREWGLESGLGSADVHGAAGDDGAWINFEFGMHGEPCLHGAG